LFPLLIEVDETRWNVLTHLRFDALTHGRRLIATAGARVVGLHRCRETVTISEQCEVGDTGHSIGQVVVTAGTVVDKILACTACTPLKAGELISEAVRARENDAS
jgi:hypothetical protein